jgi:hypothetical protein
MATKRSLAYLNALWVTGYVPTQADFEDLFVSYPNISTNNLLVGNTPALTAVYPASQSTATAITTLTNNISTGGAGISGVELPPALAGEVVIISSNTGYQNYIYPNTGEYVAPYGVNNPVTIQDGQTLMFTCSINGYWTVVSLGGTSKILKSYKAIVNQSGSGAPVATILSNSLGASPVWARTSAGIYTLTLAGAFDVAKTLILCQPAIPESPHNGGFTIQASVHTSPNQILVWTLDDSFTNVDNNQFSISIETLP